LNTEDREEEREGYIMEIGAVGYNRLQNSEKEEKRLVEEHKGVLGYHDHKH